MGCSDAIKNVLTVQKKSVGLCPGGRSAFAAKVTNVSRVRAGFSEALFCDADSKAEYCYIKGRKGFLKLVRSFTRAEHFADSFPVWAAARPKSAVWRSYPFTSSA